MTNKLVVVYFNTQFHRGSRSFFLSSFVQHFPFLETHTQIQLLEFTRKTTEEPCVISQEVVMFSLALRCYAVGMTRAFFGPYNERKKNAWK